MNWFVVLFHISLTALLLVIILKPSINSINIELDLYEVMASILQGHPFRNFRIGLFPQR